MSYVAQIHATATLAALAVRSRGQEEGLTTGARAAETPTARSEALDEVPPGVAADDRGRDPERGAQHADGADV